MREARYYIHMSVFDVHAGKEFHALRCNMNYAEAVAMFWRFHADFDNSYITLRDQDTGMIQYPPHDDPSTRY